MGVSENRKHSDAISMVEGVIAPFAGGNAGAIGGQDQAELAASEIKLAPSAFWNGHAGHGINKPTFTVAVFARFGYVETAFHRGQYRNAGTGVTYCDFFA